MKSSLMRHTHTHIPYITLLIKMVLKTGTSDVYIFIKFIGIWKSCLLSLRRFRMSSLKVSLFFSRIPLTSYKTCPNKQV